MRVNRTGGSERSPARSSATRVMIVDDHPATREGLSLRISRQPDLEVCCEVASVAEALQQAESASPDVMVVDVALPDGTGIELVKRLKGRVESLRILVWSMYPDNLYAERALQAGALGYLNKSADTDRVIEAIRAVSKGQVFLSDETARKLLHRAVGVQTPSVASPMDSFSDRELEVFELIGRGVTTADVARRLHLSPHTIDTYRQRIKAKLDITSSAELTRAAVQWVLENR
ncbi:MAG TPA: response regulator transcription factor [Planctomycetaceae bacterium]|nr:response regulator transcription factor [Planctomycetaceae bacterium]